MNCKPGVIARYVANTRNRQRLVNVERRCACSRGLFAELFGIGPMWVCTALQRFDAEGPNFQGAEKGTTLCIADRALRPLHDGDGEDEMLRIVGKPVETLEDIVREFAKENP